VQKSLPSVYTTFLKTYLEKCLKVFLEKYIKSEIRPISIRSKLKQSKIPLVGERMPPRRNPTSSKTEQKCHLHFWRDRPKISHQRGAYDEGLRSNFAKMCHPQWDRWRTIRSLALNKYTRRENGRNYQIDIKWTQRQFIRDHLIYNKTSRSRKKRSKVHHLNSFSRAICKKTR
jgi:hypothetical protein